MVEHGYFEAAAKAAIATVEAQAREIDRLRNICKLKDVIICAGNEHYKLLMKFHDDNIRLHREIAELKRQQETVDLTPEQRAEKIASQLKDWTAKPYYCSCPKCTGEVKEKKIIVCRHCSGTGHDRPGKAHGKTVIDKCAACGGTGFMEVKE